MHHAEAIERKDQPASNPRARRQIVLLDVIRFSAALLVLFFHVGFWTFLNHPEGWHTSVAPYARIGWVGVPIFFVLSGFVIAYSAEKATPSSFLKSRVLRLYPAVWLCATISLVLQAYASRVNTFMLHAWLDALLLFPVGPIIDGSYWTLRVEISFYFLVFLLLVFGWFRLIGPVMVAVSAVSLLCLATGYAVDHGLLHTSGFIQKMPHFLLWSRWSRLFLVDYAPHFAIGVLLWLVFFRGVTLARIIALAFCSLGAILSIRVEWQGVVVSSAVHYSVVPCILVWAAAVVAIVLSVRYNDAIVEWLGPSLAAKARTLGLITYPLYLLHQDFADYFVRLWAGRIPDAVIMAVATIVSLALAYSVVRFAEQPLQNRLRRLLHVERKPLPVSTLP